MNSENREAVFIPEKKSKIENIEKKYKNMEKGSSTDFKIGSLNVANNILKTATKAVGLITVIDLFVPDPVLGLDEVALASLTALLNYSSSLVENKINELEVSDTTAIKMVEVDEFTSRLSDAARNIKNSRYKNNNR